MKGLRRDPNVKSSPGLMINLNEKCMKLFPMIFDGLRVTVNKDLSSHFRATHFTYLSSITPGNYRFGATYVGTKEISPEVAYPVLIGNIDSRGNLNASMSHLFGSRFKVKFDSQMSNRNFENAELATHYLGDNFTASLIILKPNLLKPHKSGGVILQFLQSITAHWDVGTEFAYMKNMKPFKQGGLIQQDSAFSQVAMCARYSTANSCWSSLFSLHNILLCYYTQASEQLSFGIETNTNFRTNQSNASLAFQVDLKDRGIVCKGMIDTDFNVGSVFEKRISNSPFTFSLSFNLNHRLSNFRLGCGVVVE